MNKHATSNGRSKVNSGSSGKRVMKLFITYWAVAFMVVVMSFYAIAELVTLKLAYILLAATVVFAAVATFVHIRKGKKSGIDQVSQKLP